MVAVMDNSSKISHKWKPIEPIEPDNQGYDFREIDSLQRQWLNIKRQVESSTPDAYKAFTDRLTRRWAIETGIIEGIYDLDRGVTETLVREGIAADYIERNSTDKEPSELVRILKDHEESIEAVNFWIEQSRPLNKTFIQSLHIQILNSQDTHIAMNQFGDRFEATLRKGEFKIQPNNPTRSDGTTHEYCPPEQVESELDTLLSIYAEYVNEDCHPLMSAAWLHHRFEQIHPFQDGNGRVGRAILTWHLVKNGFFPIVISRDDRTEYIGSLEKADVGDLIPLIDMFARLQKNTVLQAISAVETGPQVEPESQGDLVDQVVTSIVRRAEERHVSKTSQTSRINEVAVALQAQAKSYLSEKSQSIRDRLNEANIFVKPDVKIWHTDKSYFRHPHRVQLEEIAERFQYNIDFDEYIYAIELDLDTHNVDFAPRLLFVISLHHTGGMFRSTGIMAVTAFAELRHYRLSPDPELITTSLGNAPFYNCTVTPFTFTWSDSVEEVSERFIKWTEECFSIALRHWRDNS